MVCSLKMEGYSSSDDTLSSDEEVRQRRGSLGVCFIQAFVLSTVLYLSTHVAVFIVARRLCKRPSEAWSDCKKCSHKDLH